MIQKWYMSRNGQQYGPYTWEQLKQYDSLGNIDNSDLIYSDDMSEWVKGETVPNLLGINNNYKSTKKKLAFFITLTIRFISFNKGLFIFIMIVIIIAAIISYINGDFNSLIIIK